MPLAIGPEKGRKAQEMFSDLNHLQIAGRLGRNPETKVVGNGTTMATFTIANRFAQFDELYGMREETTWLNVVAWADTAELVVAHLHKGDHVTLVGRLSIRKVDTEAGPRHYTQLVLESFQKNDRSNDKRNSGTGNGAVKGSHPSQRTVADRRFTNERNPDFDELEARR